MKRNTEKDDDDDEGHDFDEVTTTTRKEICHQQHQISLQFRIFINHLDSQIPDMSDGGGWDGMGFIHIHIYI